MELRRKRAPSPPKTSRLQPSEPLHMTTRAASKAGSNASTSRRGSLVSNGHISPTRGHDDDSERYPKRRRVSTASKTTPRRASQSSQSLSAASRPSTRSMSSGNLVPIAETPTIIKKRKRSSDQTDESISLAPSRSVMKAERKSHDSTNSPPEAKKMPPRKVKRTSTSSRDGPSARSLKNSNDETQLELNKANEAHEHQAEVADIPVVLEEPEDDEDEATQEATNGEYDESEDVVEKDASVKSEVQQRLPRQKQESNASTAASDIDAGDESFNGASMEQDDDADELNEEEDADADADADADMDADADAEEGPEGDITTSLEVAPPTINPTPAESAQASPAGSPPDSSFDQGSPTKRAVTSAPGDAVLTEDGGVSKGKKKLPGRRRAPHANPKVEAALRRQLHLRMNYRAVAKALKPILAELAHRSLSSIEKHPRAHEDASEYAGVKEGLHQHFEHRLAWIQKQKDLNKQRLKGMFDSEMEMRRTQYENVARNVQEMHVIRLQHDFLNAVRVHEQKEDGHASDDENEDVIAPLRHVTAKGTVKDILGSQFHWRSRPAVETERLFDEMYQRHLVVTKQREHDEKPGFEESRPFTTFDPTIRDSIRTDRNMDALLLALEEMEKVPTIPSPGPLPNSEAYGLQALANASAATAATDAAMREAEERAKAQEEAATKAREESIAKAKKEEEVSMRSPLSVPKPSLSQPPEEPSRSNVPTSTSTPVHTPASEPKWASEASRPDQQQQQTRQQQQQNQQPPPPQQPSQSSQSSSRPVTTFSQVALGPSLTETAPPVHIPSLNYQAPPHPVIPGLSFFPQPVQIPGLGNHLYPPTSTSSFSQQKPPTPRLTTRDPPAGLRTASQTPVVSHATPASVHSTPSRAEEQRRADYSRPQEPVESRSGTPLSHSHQSKSSSGSFWDRLAKPAKEVGTDKANVAPTELFQEPSREYISHYNRDSASSHPLDNRPLENHPLGHPSNRPTENHPLGRSADRSHDQSQERPYDHIQERIRELESNPPRRPSDLAQDHREPHYDRIQERIQELTQERPQEHPQEHRPQDHPLERHPGETTDRASSRPPSTTSSIGLESLSQKLRSTNDSFGPTDNYQSRQKKRAPKTSLYGPWPRGRNYDPFRNERDRRASVGAGPPDGPHGMQPHARVNSYSTPDHRYQPHHTPAHSQPPPPFPASAPHGGYGPPAPQYAPVPPPYGYEHASPYQQPPYRGPTGYSSLPGPPPMPQPTPPPGYYGAPPPQYAPPHHSPYAPGPPPLAARPPASQSSYGPQYGGQPILPANPGPTGYGPNGSVHGSPPGGHAGPAFAQYHRDDSRRHDYGGRGGRGRHSGGHQEWKHYQGPR